MRKLLSSIIFIGVTVFLAGLAYLAFPRSSSNTTFASPVELNNVSAVSAAENWNLIAHPLKMSDTITDAESLSVYIPGTQELLNWNPSGQTFESWIPDAVFPPPGGFGTNFTVTVGSGYFILLDSSSDSVVTFAGDVPPASGQPGAVQFNMLGQSGICQWNLITLPLDKGAITDAEGLSVELSGGNVQELLNWDVAGQTFESWIPDAVFPPPGGFGTNFTTQIGYPYFVCLEANLVWP